MTQPDSSPILPGGKELMNKGLPPALAAGVLCLVIGAAGGFYARYFSETGPSEAQNKAAAASGSATAGPGGGGGGGAPSLTLPLTPSGSALTRRVRAIGMRQRAQNK